MRLTKRALLGGSIAIAATAYGNSQVYSEDSIDIESEKQFGDPQLIELAQAIQVNQTPILDSFKTVAFGFKKPADVVAVSTVDLARTYVGKNQYDNPEMVEQFFAVFQMSAKDGRGNFYPFCAAGLSFYAATAYCKVQPNPIKLPTDSVQTIKEALSDLNRYYFRPNPLVKVIRDTAIKRKQWIDKNDKAHPPKKGWLVVFDWNGDGHPDHIGLVDKLDANVLYTVEFNTRNTAAGDQSRGGYILEKQRMLNSVMGYVSIY